MKKSFRYLLSVLVIAFVVGVVACKKDDPDYISAYAASLDGSHALPPNGTAAFGNGNVTFDSIANKMTYSISWKGLAGAPSGIYFEKGTAGTSGYKQIVITGFPAKTEGAVSGSITIDAGDESALLNSEFYSVISNSTYPNGEIRGQLIKSE